jgi:hypothetical protein
MSKKKYICPVCHRDKHSAGGLRTHQLYSKRCGKGLPVQPSQPAPARASAPAEKSITKEGWDPSWSFEQKRRYFLDSLPCDWGIRKDRNGRWKPVPMLATGLTYSQACRYADKFEFVRRMMPRRPTRRPPPADTTDGDDLLLMVLLMAMAH